MLLEKKPIFFGSNKFKVWCHGEGITESQNDVRTYFGHLCQFRIERNSPTYLWGVNKRKRSSRKLLLPCPSNFNLIPICTRNAPKMACVLPSSVCQRRKTRDLTSTASCRCVTSSGRHTCGKDCVNLLLPLLSYVLKKTHTSGIRPRRQEQKEIKGVLLH